MRVFFHEIIAAGDDASFMEVCFVVLSSEPARVSWYLGCARLEGGGGRGRSAELDTVSVCFFIESGNIHRSLYGRRERAFTGDGPHLLYSKYLVYTHENLPS